MSAGFTNREEEGNTCALCLLFVFWRRGEDACILFVSCCILIPVVSHVFCRPRVDTHISLYPVVSWCISQCILRVHQGYNKIHEHEDAMYFMYPRPNTEARTRIHRIRTEYSLLSDARGIHQDTSGYIGIQSDRSPVPPHISDRPPPRTRLHHRTCLRAIVFARRAQSKSALVDALSCARCGSRRDVLNKFWGGFIRAEQSLTLLVTVNASSSRTSGK